MISFIGAAIIMIFLNKSTITKMEVDAKNRSLSVIGVIDDAKNRSLSVIGFW